MAARNFPRRSRPAQLSLPMVMLMMLSFLSSSSAAAPLSLLGEAGSGRLDLCKLTSGAGSSAPSNRLTCGLRSRRSNQRRAFSFFSQPPPPRAWRGRKSASRRSAPGSAMAALRHPFAHAQKTPSSPGVAATCCRPAQCQSAPASLRTIHQFEGRVSLDRSACKCSQWTLHFHRHRHRHRHLHLHLHLHLHFHFHLILSFRPVA